jgi:outer membrane protein TolC
MIAAQAARLELARKSFLPDVDISVQYGQRGGNLPDMLTATLAIPIPVQKRRKQDEVTAEASTTLETLHIEHVAKVNAIRADVARLVTELERERTQLALYQKAMLPQARAALASSAAGYQVGKTEFRSLVDGQAMLFTYETDYWRALSDFATNLAELERVVGQEVIR